MIMVTTGADIDAHAHVAEVIEQRCQRLEALVFGPGELASASTRTNSEGAVSALERLCGLIAAGGASVGSRDRIRPLLRRLPELETYLDPTFLDDEAHLSAAVKADLILAQQDQLRGAAQTWERLRRARSGLEASGRIAERLDPLQARLGRVTLKHLEQDGRALGVERDTLAAMARYNELMGTISETFCRYDRTITRQLDQQA